MKFTLYGRPGWGSVLVEPQLALYGFDYEMIDCGDLFGDEEARQRLAKVNPLMQVPTLVLPNGRIMTESAAITLHLADLAKSNKLVPSPDDPTRAEFLRWLIFLVASLYPTFAFGDVPTRFVADPEAAKDYKAKVCAYRESMWHMVEGAARAPWFLGDRFSAIDLYLVAMTYWFPRREWFAAHAPKLTTIAKTTEGAPKLSEIWKRNFLR